MVCPERARLLIDYRDAVYRYSQRVADLVELAGLELDTDVEIRAERRGKPGMHPSGLV